MSNKLLLLCISCNFLFSCTSNPTIELINSEDVSRTDAQVTLDRSTFDNIFDAIPAGSFPYIKLSSGEYLPAQHDDLDGDGKWDQMAFLVKIEAKSTLLLNIELLTRQKAPQFSKRTQVFLGHKQADGSFIELKEASAPLGLDGFPSPFQAEGVTWESEKMGFRVYFDCRNAKDLFGKLKPDLIAHRAGSKEFGNYHELADWGMDILHCGSSLGAGGLAILQNDTLYRVGSTNSYEYKEIADGPVRSIFELSYNGFNIGSQMLTVKETITIWGGQYGFTSQVVVDGLEKESELVTGIVTTKLSTEPHTLEANDQYTAILTHGQQSLNNDVLAMAIMSPTDDLARISHTGNTNYFLLGDRRVPSKNFSYQISETYYLSQKIISNKPSTHYFFAFWALENPEWNSVESVKKHIQSLADNLSHPITIIKMTK